MYEILKIGQNFFYKKSGAPKTSAKTVLMILLFVLFVGVALSRL